MDRRLFIVIAVIGGHALGLWALQTGLLHRAVEFLVPVQLLAGTIEPPSPTPAATTPKPRTQETPVQPPLHARPMIQPLAQTPTAIAHTSPDPDATTGATAPQPPAPEPLTSPPNGAPAPTPSAAADTAAPRKTFPSTDIDYRFRPQPAYPTQSVRMNEHGVVTLKALVSKEGYPVKVIVVDSSGYLRLDNIAEQTVKNRWRFTPGTLNGIPVDMEATFTIRFSLDP